MIDPYLLAGILIFFAGVILLRRTSAKSYIIFFMIHTKHGLRFVDRMAKISPGFWKFLGDMAIVVSFGGLGGYYVSRYRNTWLVTGFIGVAALVFTYISSGAYYAGMGLLILVLGMMLLRKKSSPFFHLIAATAVMGTVTYNIYPIFAGIEIFRPYISLLVGFFGIPALLVSMLFLQAFEIVFGGSIMPGVSPLLPTIGEEGPGFFFPGTGIFIPLWQALIAIICLLVPHEFAHGILMRCHKIKLKSAGLLTAGPIPIGAFVEPDEKEMSRHESMERMRIYAAGSFTNIMVAIIAIALIAFVMVPMATVMTEPTGMMITNVVNNTPADGVLERGSIIEEINGMPTLDVKSFNLAVENIKPGQLITFLLDNGTAELTTVEHPTDPGRGYIGIDLREASGIKEEFKNEYRMQAEAVLFISSSLFWVFFLSFNVALVNLLPIIPFDGGKMFEEYMREFRISKRRKEIIQKTVIFIILLLILVNASPLFRLVLV